MSKPLTKEIMKELAKTTRRLNNIYHNYGLVSCECYGETVQLTYEDFCDYCSRYGIEYETEAEYTKNCDKVYFFKNGIEYFSLTGRATYK